MTNLVADKVRVLIVDDEDVSFSREVIAKAGIAAEVFIAEDYETALYKVLSEFYDLVLLDLNLHHGSPYLPETFEGLWILEELKERGLNGYLPIVVLTAYGTTEIATNAFRDFKVLDFWDTAKSSSGELASMLIDRLRDPEHNYFGLRNELTMEPTLNWRVLVQALSYQFARVTLPLTETEAEIELNHLLRKLLRSSKKTHLKPISARGFSGANVLKATRFFEDGTQGSEVVIKYSTADQILTEAKNWESISYFTRGTKITNLLAHERSLNLGAVCYSLIGARDESIKTFGEFYLSSGADQINEALDDLFEESCDLWYLQENRRPVKNYDLEEVYCRALGLNRDNLEKAFLFKFPGKSPDVPRIDFQPHVPGSYAHPVAAFCNSQTGYRLETHECRTHGDLHVGNLLVDAHSRDVWLIDFQKTGWGHCLRDFVCLELSLKFILGPAHDLYALFEAEHALTKPNSLAESIEYDRRDQPELIKLTKVISHLRGLAHTLVQPQGDALEYYFALFYQTLAFLRLHKVIRANVRKNHVLLSACVLYDKITGLRETAKAT